VAAPHIDYLLKIHKNGQTDRQDFENLLRQAALILGTPKKSPKQPPPRKATVVSTTKVLQAKAG
jgi:hypothetical protein